MNELKQFKDLAWILVNERHYTKGYLCGVIKDVR